MKKCVKTVLSLISASAILFSSGCKSEYKEKKVYAEELTANMKVEVEAKDLSGEFISAYDDFAVEFFKRSKNESNFLVSPLSASACLSMAFNGADGETLSEFEGVFKNIEIAELNRYFKKIIDGADENLKIADSVWLNKEKANANEEFLKAVKSYYNAEVYRAKFDDKLVGDINNWAENKTNGMIKEILKETSPEFYMYLMNALYFSSKWEEEYEKGDIYNSEFRNADGTKTKCEMMRSKEGKYFTLNGADGFMKYYKGGKYAFMAILPKEDDDIGEFIDGLNGEDFKKAITNATYALVNAEIPKFSYDYSIEMKDLLMDMGIRKAFSPYGADFTKMRKEGGLFIDFVLQKTRIELDENGTKAAAVTIIGMKDNAYMPPEKEINVILDRPFVYSIISVEDGLPLFIGSVNKL